jgi:hypothetical protein
VHSSCMSFPPRFTLSCPSAPAICEPCGGGRVDSLLRLAVKVHGTRGAIGHVDLRRAEGRH